MRLNYYIFFCIIFILAIFTEARTLSLIHIQMCIKDSLNAVENITRILGQANSQIGDNPQVKMMIVQMLKGGLEKKMKMFRENPDNYSLNRQVELINKAINNYSN